MWEVLQYENSVEVYRRTCQHDQPVTRFGRTRSLCYITFSHLVSLRILRPIEKHAAPFVGTSGANPVGGVKFEKIVEHVIVGFVTTGVREITLVEKPVSTVRRRAKFSLSPARGIGQKDRVSEGLCYRRLLSTHRKLGRAMRYWEFNRLCDFSGSGQDATHIIIYPSFMGDDHSFEA